MMDSFYLTFSRPEIYVKFLLGCMPLNRFEIGRDLLCEIMAREVIQKHECHTNLSSEYITIDYRH